MTDTRTVLAGALLIATMATAPAWAAAPADDLDAATPRSSLTLRAHDDPSFDTEMVVRDWVLCVSAAVAEELVTALDQGADEAAATYARLKAARSCGQFGELRVILHEAVFRSRSDRQATVFSADIGFADAWAKGFVVEGALPAH